MWLGSLRIDATFLDLRAEHQHRVVMQWPQRFRTELVVKLVDPVHFRGGDLNTLLHGGWCMAGW